MTPLQDFAQRWATRGREKSDTQLYWIDLLGALGAADPTSLITFEEPVKVGKSKKYIDALIPTTAVLIEQKKRGVSATKVLKQSDGTLLTPFRQATRYAAHLPYSKRPRWIVVCNFDELHIHDMERPDAEAVVVQLHQIEQEAERLRFLLPSDTGQPVDSLREREERVSLEAGRLVGKLYDLLLPQYQDPTATHTLHSLNILCVRLVFCMYAEDAGLFDERHAFCRYMERFEGDAVVFREKLLQLFDVLDTPLSERDPYMDEQLARFPYVNGGLFAKTPIEVPRLTPNIIATLVHRAGFGFDWSVISPTIFGAVFESTLNPDTRRAGGMHYTSVENIHRVIDPLFLDGLRDRLAVIRAERQSKARRMQLLAFQEHLSTLRFFDPACGSGNFLTEVYLSLRRLENEVIRTFLGKERDMATLGYAFTPVRVSIGQCYGIEINDFAAVVAKTALWIAESQMLRETESIINQHMDFFPLRSYANVMEGNALRTDWHTLTPEGEAPTSEAQEAWYAGAQEAYVIGNPPFVGARLMNPAQKEDLLHVFGKAHKQVGNLDYVAGWYRKATTLMQADTATTTLRSALVSTNSICQGEAVGNLWAPLFAEGVHIDFAHHTFRWNSESIGMAHVHCVIVGFSIAPQSAPPRLYGEGNTMEVCTNINAYLVEGSNTCVVSRTKPLCAVPPIGIGNKPIDGGHYLFTHEERDAFVTIEPASATYFRPWYGAQEFINQKPRYCLWLGDCSPHVLRQMPHAMKRIEAVRQERLASKSAGTRKLADTPTRFHVENMPESTYIIVPSTSSERREYVPMGFIPPVAMASNACLIIPSATIYHFGVLTSWVHNAWMRAVCGRLKSDYRYSKDIVYNNFPWPTPTPTQVAKIEATAQHILDVRQRYPEASLADLYDPITMPADLRQAHRANDRAVLTAYGLKAPPATASVTEIAEAEPALVTYLMERYEALTR